MVKKFEGLLAERLEPIYVDNVADIARGAPNPELLAIRRESENQKFQLVLEHYKVLDSDPSTQRNELVWHLLREFVVGFQIAAPSSRTGRHKVWDFRREGFLVFEMGRVIADTDSTAADAARVLAGKEPWKTICHQAGGGSDPAETLRSRYYLARRRKKLSQTANVLYAREKNNPQLAGLYDAVLMGLAVELPHRSYV